MTPPPLPGRAGPRPPQIERFLGPEALQRGPFGLLGVTPSFCTDEHLLAALQRQLARVDAHSEAESAEAQRFVTHFTRRPLRCATNTSLKPWSGSGGSPGTLFEPSLRPRVRPS